MVGSSIDRCPRCAATGSAGTLCETTNAINVIPSISGSMSRTLLITIAGIYSPGLGGALRARSLSGLGGALRAPLTRNSYLRLRDHVWVNAPTWVEHVVTDV